MLLPRVSSSAPCILHIANDYAGSTVYAQLVAALDAQGVSQAVFTTVRDSGAAGRNAVDFLQAASAIHYSDNWRCYHRLLFHEKVRSNFNALRACVNLQRVDYVHAHTLFSDGALALKIKKEYGIPYIATVRNTDINGFMRYMFHTWPVGREVIRMADRVVFISPAHLRRATKWVFAPKEDLLQKSVNIPNGVNSYWLEHLNCSPLAHVHDSVWRLICVANAMPNKNIPRLMRAVLALRGEGIPLTLDIVGGHGSDSVRIEKIAQVHPTVFTLHGEIKDKERLRGLFRESHIFCLPSLHETFGLVYVEALTQGLPILYSHGEGVDGFFSEHYGRACDPSCISSIADGLRKIINGYAGLSIDGAYLRNWFDWGRIADRYMSIYGMGE